MSNHRPHHSEPLERSSRSFAAAVVTALMPYAGALGDSGLSANLEIGGRYDSNVAVIDVDRSSGEGDFAALFSAGVAYDQPLGKRTSVKVGYNFGQSLHADFDDFDLQTHRGSIDARFDAGVATLGTSYQYVHARLGGDKFMVLQQVSPYVARSYADGRFYVRAGYEYTDKSFSGRPTRDAEAHAVSGMLFWFLDGVDRYWLFRYRYRDEDAVDPALEYRSHEGSVQYVQRFDVAGQRVTGRLRMGYETRDYRAVTEEIGAKRDDSRLRLQSSLSIPLGERSTVAVTYKYGALNSNLPAVDFDEHVVELTYSAKL
ncbi:MAG: DUF560 domain-containing protein [Gammaproteobacteria bacterium]|nr:DUF560 domain-containing protein [Gammaproteobacteria bacterium]